jgi:hypothetical protein
MVFMRSCKTLQSDGVAVIDPKTWVLTRTCAIPLRLGKAAWKCTKVHRQYSNACAQHHRPPVFAHEPAATSHGLRNLPGARLHMVQHLGVERIKAIQETH